MGVEKQVYTLLIWTLLLVLSLSTLSRASKPRIASIAMNSILRTCKFINSCIYSRSTRIHNACPSSVCTLRTTLVQVHKYIYSTLEGVREEGEAGWIRSGENLNMVCWNVCGCTLGTTLVQVHKYIYIYSPQDQNLHGSIDTLGRDSLAFNCLQQSLDPMYYNKP